MLRKILLACALSLVSCGGAKPEAKPPVTVVEIPKPPTRITWRKPSPEALREAVATQHMMILFFHNQSCTWCKVMKDHTLTDLCVVDEINKHFVFVGVDADEFPGLVDTYLEEKVFPSTMFVLPDSEGTVIPIAVQGYVPADKYCKVLKMINKELEKNLKHGD